MSRQTLDTMWDVINGAKPALVQYLERKAKLLGVEQLSWSDVDAPVGKSGGKVTYDEAAINIVEQFAKFSPNFPSLQRWLSRKAGLKQKTVLASVQGDSVLHCH